MSLPFLLEIGAEEIPDWMIPGALENLRSLFEETLAKTGIPAPAVRVDGTPRRLVLQADGLIERQADAEELVMGPPKAAPDAAVAGAVILLHRNGDTAYTNFKDNKGQEWEVHLARGDDGQWRVVEIKNIEQLLEKLQREEQKNLNAP